MKICLPMKWRGKFRQHFHSDFIRETIHSPRKIPVHNLIPAQEQFSVNFERFQLN